MLNTLLSAERRELLSERGGPSAMAFWLLRNGLWLDVYALYTLDLQRQHVSPAASLRDCRLLRIACADDLLQCPLELQNQISPHTGLGLQAVIAQGGRVYALVHGNQVLSQARIDIGTSNANTPCRLCFDLGLGNAFLSFLYTHPQSRRGGWAKKLMTATCHSLAQEGLLSCFSHVQATNLRSVNTFKSMGWQGAGWLIASRRGRYLGSLRLYRGIHISPVLA